MAPVLRPRDHGYGTHWSLIGLDSWVSGGDPVARRARARENISTIQEALARAACKRRGQRLACEEAMADQLEMREAVVASGGTMPDPRLLDLPLLPTGQGERFYLERFMRVFGEDWNGTAIVEAPSGHQLAVSSLLFTDHKKGGSKVDKRGRVPYVKSAGHPAFPSRLLFRSMATRRPAVTSRSLADASVQFNHATTLPRAIARPVT